MKIVVKVLKITLIFVLFCSIAAALYWLFATSGLKLDTGLLSAEKSAFIMYDVNDEEISSRNSDYAEISEIPKELINCFIAVEDKRFFQHKGVDYRRMVSAVIQNVKDFQFSEGASTITQQLIKNTHLSSEKNLTRKLQEIKLAIEAEKILSKEEILEAYLNKIYFGSGYYGVKQAAKGYFNKELHELSLKESACLAGIIKNPSKYSPGKDHILSEKRANLVLKLMMEQNLISKEIFERETSESIILNADLYNNISIPYFDSVVYEAEKILGIDSTEITNGNYKIYTYYSPEDQSALLKSIKSRTSNSAYSHYGIIVDNLTLGISAYTNSTPYFNAFTLRRSPGSLIKPFVSYLPALSISNLTPVSLIDNTKQNFNGYSPKNFNNYYSDREFLRTAVEKSLNVPCVALCNELGINTCANYARKYGLNVNKVDEYLPLALGGMSSGLNAIELCTAYSTLANLGNKKTVSFIRRIEDSYGRILYDDNRQTFNIESEENVYLMNDMLNSTAKIGTAKRLSELKFDVFAKTGTIASANTSYNEGAYCAAFTSCNTAIMWLGNVTATPENGVPSEITGATLPTEIIKGVFSKLYADSIPASYVPPAGLTKITFNLDAYLESGIIMSADNGSQNTKTDYFRTSQLPEQVLDVKKSNISDFNINITDNGAKISFTSNKWINYKIEKRNGIRSEIIFDKMGNGDKFVLFDKNIDDEECYCYTITPYIMNFYGEMVLGPSVSKTLIIKNDGYNDEFGDYFE